MSTTKIAERFIMWRISGVQMAEKRLMALLASDVSPGSSDQDQGSSSFQRNGHAFLFTETF